MPDASNEKKPTVNEKTVESLSGKEPSAGKKPASTIKAEKKASPAAAINLIFLVVLMGAFYFIWQQHIQLTGLNSNQSQLVSENENLRNQLQLVQQEITNINDADSSAEILFNQQNARLDNLNEELLNLRMGMSANQASGIWQLSEASSYLRLARQYLELVQNVPVALDLYRDSRAILAQVNDPALDRITGMLTSDISLLNQITEVDTESLYIRLSELSQLVTEVRLGPSIEPSQAFNERESDNGQEGSEGGLSGLFSRYFTIQRLDAPLTLPLNVEQRSLLRQNMQLQIEQAKLALMQKRQAVYLDSISSVIMLAQQNIPDEDPQKMYLIRSLRELQNEAISLDLPALSDSLRLLDNLIINIR